MARINFHYRLTYQLNLNTGVLTIIDEQQSPNQQLNSTDITSETAYELDVNGGGSGQRELVITPNHQISNPDFHYSAKMTDNLSIFIHRGKLDIDLPPKSGTVIDLFIIGEDNLRSPLTMQMAMHNKITLQFDTSTKVLHVRMNNSPCN